MCLDKDSTSITSAVHVSAYKPYTENIWYKKIPLSTWCSWRFLQSSVFYCGGGKKGQGRRKCWRVKEEGEGGGVNKILDPPIALNPALAVQRSCWACHVLLSHSGTDGSVLYSTSGLTVQCVRRNDNSTPYESKYDSKLVL